MSEEVGDRYDERAEEYASLFLSDLDRDPEACRWLQRFDEMVDRENGLVIDVGCGPGHVSHHLTQLGLDVVGIDISAGQITEARAAFAELRFDVGDFAALDQADSSLGGIVSRYSIIHTPPAELAGVFAEWKRALAPGAPVLVSFFGSLAVGSHGSPFDHTVVTAYELFPATIAELLVGTGFVDIETDAVPAPEGARRPFDQATILARAPQALAESKL